eukprot:TRINITY_DN2297_c0_g1_i1.p1 TRINITY_DN2297_c0_g1~~TRINITY_DN2297_c0_g1_i1.p1  ORF type:complete len:420 (-),score=58.18 TRINITY_DN2297_c0_g1_i1:119-1378(-)
MKSLRRTWRGLHKHRKFFDSLSKTLNLSSLEDWYKYKSSDIRNFGGSGLLRSAYSDSYIKALVTVYPEHEWKLWKFKAHVPQNFWTLKTNRRSFFEWLGQELGYVSFNCWYRITCSDIKRNGGAGLLPLCYKDSVYNALIDLYPEYPWIPWRFNKVPHKFWSDLTHHRDFMIYLGKELGFLDFTDFYRLTVDNIISHGGSGFAQLYRRSPYLCLKTIFPDFNWSATKFAKPTRKSIAPRSFDSSIFSSVSVKDISDWYRMPLSRIKKFGILNKAELIKALKQHYPEFQWNVEQFQIVRRKTVQWKLRRLLEEILENKSPEISIFEDYWRTEGVTYSKMRNMELDLFVLSLNLAFEYHGLQHFKDHYFFGPSKDYKLKDEQKRLACKRIGITLIEVPYDLMLEELSVVDLLRRCRPDIIH